MPYIAVAVGIVLAIADQIIKFFVSTNLKEIGSVSVIDNLLSFTYVENNGVAFGSFAGNRWIFCSAYNCTYCRNLNLYV